MRLTENFTKADFDSKNGDPMPDDVLQNVQKLANNLQVLRNTLNAPIIINSGYRSPSHNKAVGGAVRSQHLTGKASDIVVRGYTPKQVFDEIERLINRGEMLQGGLKAYNTFVHYDIRKARVRW